LNDILKKDTEKRLDYALIIEIEQAYEKNSNDWDKFNETNVFSTPFHAWSYGKSISSTYGIARYHLIARNEHKKIIGTFPLVLIRSRIFGSKLLSLPYCEYGGPLVTENVIPTLPKLIDYAVELSSKLNIDYIEIRNPSLRNKVFFEDKHFKPIQKYVSFDINLKQQQDVLWNSLNRKNRNAIRKAMRSDLEIVEIDTGDKKGIEKYYSLYLKVQQRLGSPPHSLKLFKNFAMMKKNIKIIMVEYEETAVGGMIFFYNKQGIYWWSGVSDSAHRKLNVTNYQLWEMIKWGNENGFPRLSLGRTRKDSGVYNFKKRWGGVEVLLTDYIYMIKKGKINTPDPTNKKYRYLTKAWSHIPMSISKYVGPYIVKQIGL
jgi:FemAB-related protein (PEP-CTERM system-associated)